MSFFKTRYGHQNGTPVAGSSPRSILTPLGPTRLTLPPGQTVQELSSHALSNHNDTGLHPTHGSGRTQMHSSNGAQRRPSSKLMEQYAYAPPETPQLHLPHLSLAQAVPKSLQRQKGAYDGRLDAQRIHTPVPPTTLSRTNPGPNISKQLGPPRSSSAATQPQRIQTNMGPPPTPQHLHQRTQANSGFNPNETSSGLGSSGARATHPFLDVSDTLQDPRTSTSAPQRFFDHRIASTHAGNSLQVFNPGSRAPSRASPPRIVGQRMPFVPAARSLNHQGRFG